uniref:Chloride intracellular channel 3 n=1 Tax=Macaca fascicularis TaxID=9541 RepID=A0A7N9CJH6_MACFA
MAETKLQLFVKASEDGESVGHCPSCQRLFMVLLLKGVPFTLTTLPILLYDSDAKTDTLQIEDFLEETLGPPDFPSLAPRYRESNTAGNDVFHKFSAFIKNPVPAREGVLALYQQLLRALARLDSYLQRPWSTSWRWSRSCSPPRFLDGDRLTLADCSLLPKLHIVAVCAHFRQAPIPAGLPGVRRYLDSAAGEEFKYVSAGAEILAATGPPCTPASAPPRVCRPIKASLSAVRVS